MVHFIKVSVITVGVLKDLYEMFEETDLWFKNTDSVHANIYLQILQNLEFTDAKFLL
jgi:hypothetical protein